MRKQLKIDSEKSEEILNQKIIKLEQTLQQERESWIDLINNQPAGIYRIRVFPRQKWQENAWDDVKNPPYSVESVNNRFCEILGMDRHTYETNPGIVIGLVHAEDKAEFTRKNEEANANLIPFQWEGRFVVGKKIIWAHLESLPRPAESGDILWTGILYDITERKEAEIEREKLILELQEALKKVKLLSGLIPVCASCKKIRNDEGYWEQIEIYIRDHSEADFSHGICPDCAKQLYPNYKKTLGK